MLVGWMPIQRFFRPWIERPHSGWMTSCPPDWLSIGFQEVVKPEIAHQELRVSYVKSHD